MAWLECVGRFIAVIALLLVNTSGPCTNGPAALRLVGVDDVPWGRLETGFGAPAIEVPDVLRALRAGGSGSVVVHGMDFGVTEALWAVVTHQGTMGTATAVIRRPGAGAGRDPLLPRSPRRCDVRC